MILGKSGEERFSNKLESAFEFHSETDALSLDIDREDLDLYDISYGKDLAGMLDVAVTDLGDVNETVLVDSDVYECAEIYNVAYSSREDHIGLEVFH